MAGVRRSPHRNLYLLELPTEMVLLMLPGLRISLVVFFLVLHTLAGVSSAWRPSGIGHVARRWCWSRNRNRNRNNCHWNGCDTFSPDPRSCSFFSKKTSHKNDFLTGLSLAGDGVMDDDTKYPRSGNHHFLPTTIKNSEDMRLLLDRMIAYFESMIDQDTGRFFLYSYPRNPSDPQLSSLPSNAGEEEEESPSSCCSHSHCPIRDLGSAWDATKAIKVLRHNSHGDHSKDGTISNFGLEDAVLLTINHYESSLVALGGETRAVCLSAEVLEEPPNIAHNALLLLALIGANELQLFGNHEQYPINDRFSEMEQLVQGILVLQRPDGAFRTRYLAHKSNDNESNNNDDVYGGIEFFPGEAMTALMDFYLHSCQASREGFAPSVASPTDGNNLQLQILKTMLRALSFYRSYYEEGRRQNTIDTNYSIWQVQSFSRLVLALQQPPPTQQQLSVDLGETAAREAADYCIELCGDIIRSPAWKLLSRGSPFYPNLSTIEIACGLDALCQGAMVLNADNNNHQSGLSFSLLLGHIERAVDFLKWSQDRVPADSIFGYGGLGNGGYCVTEQRLDVTGHALGAVAKLVGSSTPSNP